MPNTPYLSGTERTRMSAKVAAGQIGWVLGKRECSASEVQERDLMVREGNLRVLRLLPAHGNDWPLWGRGLGPVEPADVGLSESLASELRHWGSQWQRAADAELDDADQLSEAQFLDREWFVQGEELCEFLAVEVWERAVVVPEFRSYWGEF